MPTELSERASIATAPDAHTGTGIVQIITPGWGSSGYYSPGVLAEAAAAKVFGKGTKMYVDHPTESEAYERPERSVQEIAGVLTEDARVDADGGLVAAMQVVKRWREPIAELASLDAIGCSIRAAGVTESGEAEGRRGPIVTALTEGRSVDFVTDAGRGGKVLVLEADRLHMAEAVSNAAWGDVSQADYTIEQWRRACLIHPDQTSDDKGDYKLPVRMPDGTLNRNAVHAAAQRFGQIAGVSADDKKAAARKLVGLYRSQLKEDPPASLLSAAGMSESVSEARNIAQGFESRIHQNFTNMADDAAAEGHLAREERIALSGAISDALDAFNKRIAADVPHLYQRDPYQDAPNNVPVNPAGQSTTPHESKEDNMAQIEEARLRELEEAHGRVPTLEADLAEARAAREAAEAALALRDRADRIRTLIGEAEQRHGVEFSRLEVAGLIAGAPLTTDGALDETVLVAQLDAEAKPIAEAAPSPVTGFGGTTPSNTGTDNTGLAESLKALDESLNRAFTGAVKEA